jgi:hypothetical protein
MYILVPECDLSELDGDFMEEEVKCAIFWSASDKGPLLFSFFGGFRDKLLPTSFSQKPESQICFGL